MRKLEAGFYWVKFPDSKSPEVMQCCVQKIGRRTEVTWWRCGVECHMGELENRMNPEFVGERLIPPGLDKELNPIRSSGR